MKMIVGLVGLFLMVASVALARPLDWPKAKVTIRVVGEDGVAISNATVHIGFSQGGNAWIGERKGETFHGQSDSNGCYSVEAKSEMSVGGSVEKAGYYRSFWEYTFGGNYQEIERWEPWNPTNAVVLRKIGKPVPMYAKRVDVRLPAFNVQMGYDLGKGDWVAPHGKGSVGDLVFEVARRVANQDNYDAILTIGISRQGDGFREATALGPHGSVFRLSAEAPAEGYQRNLVVKWGRNPSAGGTYGNVGDDYTPNYFFRVRSEVDDKGNILHALYGKVHGAFRITGVLRDEARLSFTYYLNPTPNDRNLEFDPSRNLFTTLKSTECVTDP